MFKIETKQYVCKFDGTLNVNKKDSWIHSLEAYFKTEKNLTHDTHKLLVIKFHMQDQALT
jgi:hypothetical protein